MAFMVPYDPVNELKLFVDSQKREILQPHASGLSNFHIYLTLELYQTISN